MPNAALKSIAVLLPLVFSPVLSVLALEANFPGLSLEPGFAPTPAVVSGRTGGSTSLPAIVGATDSQKKTCLGFGSPNPDHILVLEKDFPRLKIQVSSGADTTLAIIGPNSNTVRCGDDTGSSLDASVEDVSWKAGTYKIWIGVMQAGLQRNYTLSVSE
ncbi:MAG TPA: hypothetical protein IGS52_14665 [Oscillatoriaceae cyanobacterium M33_DOE_052]|uniref:Peptidase S1 n=1 Tax=Planktothricoides sp. SpSt-374 TaxID=2282167 RepID=A0A7C3ZMR9_9CYAN|nr:hypothetical protein [Oscillatoriaceae cyanobacterium M33_DOE_052]